MSQAQQQRIPLWAAEEEIGEDLQDSLGLSIADYQNVQYDDYQPQIDESTLLAMQQQIQQQAAFSLIPDVVKAFIVHFHQAVLDNNLPEITIAYESGWNKYTEKFYAKTEWPEAEVIAPLVNDDPIFLILYRELYYRHVYSRLQPNIDDRFHSYENSCELFNYLLNSDGPVKLELPEQWLWDIIDEFIYQFQVFCSWRSKIKSKSEDELSMLADAAQVWSSYSVLNVLYSLIQKSKINEYVIAQQEGKSQEEIAEIVGEFGVRPLYRMLGYFSLVGLLRVHTLLGDFTLALKVLDAVELNPKSPFTRVTACHVSTYYHVGFCYIMLRRYPDAIRQFVTILNFIIRMRQYHTRSYQYDQISKTADRMYALFAICNALSPSRLDDHIANISKERYGEQFAKMAKGTEEALPAFEELFVYASPKFIAANPPPYNVPEALAALLSSAPAQNEPATIPSTAGAHPQSHPSLEPAHRHLHLFLNDVRAALPVPSLRGFLKLYSSLDLGKAARFLDSGEQGEGEEEVCAWLMGMKMSGRSVVWRGGKEEGGRAGLLEGEMIVTGDLNFVINENMIHIAESTIGRRYAGWFINNTERAQRFVDELRKSPLPARAVSSSSPVVPTSGGAGAISGGDQAGGESGGGKTAGGKGGKGGKVSWASGVKT